ncbi:MAG: PQQ-like beta-propeller repeat protein [Planctomycetes bacterium]|nr:PQQ-like beta-propeller repeat protein [Planctomycetota bacterium]
MTTLRLLGLLACTGLAPAQTGYLIDAGQTALFSVDVASGSATQLASTYPVSGSDLTYMQAADLLWTITDTGGSIGILDQVSGAFTPVYQLNSDGWRALAWDDATQRFYLANRDGRVYRLDPATGAPTLLGDSGFESITCLDTDVNGNLFGITSPGHVVQIDKDTGYTTMLSQTLARFSGLGIDRTTGVWYATNSDDDSLHTIDPATGTTVAVGPHGAGIGIATGFDLIDTAVDLATAVRIGSGCYDTATAAFYESFDHATVPFDLSDSSLEFTWTGAGYVGVPGPTPDPNTSTAWFTPSTAFPLGGDQVRVANLGFTLPYPGGSTTRLWISSNGFVWLQRNTDAGCCAGSGHILAVAPTPRWAAFWNDLQPVNFAGVYFDVDAPNGAAYVTFDSVPTVGTVQVNTFQLGFHATGDVELRWRTCQAATRTTVVGFGPGAAHDPGGIDLSAVGQISSYPDINALALTSDARPVIGTTVNLTVGEIPTASALAAVVYGLQRLDPALDLTGFGMPGCFGFVSPDAAVLAIGPGASFADALAIPNSPGLAGVAVKAQGAVFGSSAIPNAAGAITSNGLVLTLDLN